MTEKTNLTFVYLAKLFSCMRNRSEEKAFPFDHCKVKKYQKNLLS